LIFAAICFACNGEHKITFIDCLFNCVSAMTVCGLTVNNLSALTSGQQTILFVLMFIGSPVSSFSNIATSV
jgi:Trk-type K+ transport system membrane component